jgi:3-oxoacyl-ACP reductase-like protein
MSARPATFGWNPAAVLGGALLLLSASSLAAQTSGESAYETVLKELVGALDAVTKVFAGVTNEAGARAAVPEVKKAVTQIKEVQKKVEALPQPEKAEKDRVSRLYRSKLQDSINKLSSEVARVKAIPGGSELAALLRPVQMPKEDQKK